MKKAIILSFFIFHFSFSHSQTWSRQPNFPGLQRDDAVAVTVGNVAYYGLGLAVGWTNQDDWWSYDKTNGWQQKTDFPGAARQYAAATSLGKYVYVFGGLDPAITALNDFWRYDTENNSWENLASLPSIGRQAPMLVSLNDKLLVGMGRNDTVYFDDCWLYDPNKDTFELATFFPGDGRYYPAYANVAGNVVLAHGKSLPDCLDDSWFYGSGDNEWHPLGYSPHTGCNYVAYASKEYSLIIGGGLNASNEFLNDYYEYNIRENKWTKLPDLPAVPRKGASMFVLDEELYLINGIDSSFTRLNEVWKLSWPEDEKPHLEIHPNPVSSWLHIYMDEEMRDLCEPSFTISLYDAIGRNVYRQNYTMSDLGLWFPTDLSHLKSGLYLLQVENCEGIKTEKIIVE